MSVTRRQLGSAVEAIGKLALWLKWSMDDPIAGYIIQGIAPTIRKLFAVRRMQTRVLAAARKEVKEVIPTRDADKRSAVLDLLRAYVRIGLDGQAVAIGEELVRSGSFDRNECVLARAMAFIRLGQIPEAEKLVERLTAGEERCAGFDAIDVFRAERYCGQGVFDKARNEANSINDPVLKAETYLKIAERTNSELDRSKVRIHPGTLLSLRGRGEVSEFVRLAKENVRLLANAAITLLCHSLVDEAFNFARSQEAGSMIPGFERDQMYRLIARAFDWFGDREAAESAIGLIESGVVRQETIARLVWTEATAEELASQIPSAVERVFAALAFIEKGGGLWVFDRIIRPNLGEISQEQKDDVHSRMAIVCARRDDLPLAITFARLVTDNKLYADLVVRLSELLPTSVTFPFEKELPLDLDDAAYYRFKVLLARERDTKSAKGLRPVHEEFWKIKSPINKVRAAADLALALHKFVLNQK